jgi:adenylosuccinate lyase
MLHLFSSDMRFQTWRKLWVELARAEHELGLPVTQAQVDELAAHVTDIDYDVVAQREKESATTSWPTSTPTARWLPGAAGIIHLGATSCYVTDNADLILYRDGCAISGASCWPFIRNLSVSPTNTSRHCPPWATPIISPPSW